MNSKKILSFKKKALKKKQEAAKSKKNAPIQQSSSSESSSSADSSSYESAPPSPALTKKIDTNHNNSLNDNNDDHVWEFIPQNAPKKSQITKPDPKKPKAPVRVCQILLKEGQCQIKNCRFLHPDLPGDSYPDSQFTKGKKS